MSYLLGRPVEASDIRRVTTELTGPSVRADSVFELIGEPTRHVEFEKNARPERLHPRLLTYFERLHTADGIAPEQYVVVLERSNGRLPGIYRTGRLQLEYNVIHLWEEPPDRLMADPGLSPLAVLAHRKVGESALGRVEEVLERINTVDDPERRRQLIADAATFATITLDSTTLLKLLRRYTAMPLYVEEMPFYEEAVERGLQRGLQRGKARH